MHFAGHGSFLRFTDNDLGDDQTGRNQKQGQTGHCQIDPSHHDDGKDQREDPADDLGQGLLQRIGQGVDIIGNAAEHIPVFMRIKIANRQTLYLFLQRLAQIVGRILNGIGQHERHDDPARWS